MEQMDHGTSIVISGGSFFLHKFIPGPYFLSKKKLSMFLTNPKKNTNNEKGHIYHGEISLSRVFFTVNVWSPINEPKGVRWGKGLPITTVKKGPRVQGGSNSPKSFMMVNAC